MIPPPAYPEFKDKRALVTGATQGIGKAIAWRLARQGASVYLNHSGNAPVADETLGEFRAAGLQARLLEADVGSPEAVAAMLARVHGEGPLDLLVCNAAYQEKRGFFDTDLPLLQRTFDVNVFGNFQLVRAVAQAMAAAGIDGRMVVCSSGQGKHVFEGAFSYAISKATLNHLTRCAALELIERGIRLNALDIGWVHTPGERRWYSEEEQTALARTIPIGRAAQPDDIAAVAEFLLSDQARYVVGSLYLVDGGFALRPNPNT